jgi:hypothetical protein
VRVFEFVHFEQQDLQASECARVGVMKPQFQNPLSILSGEYDLVHPCLQHRDPPQLVNSRVPEK